MSALEEKLTAALAAYQSRIIRDCGLLPELMLLETTRALDSAAYDSSIASRTEMTEHEHERRRFRILGAATALQPLVRSLERTNRGVPDVCSDEALSQFTDSYLYNCGLFAHVRRLAGLERYGLAASVFINDDHAVLEVDNDYPEQHDLRLLQWLQDAITDDAHLREHILHSEVVKRLDRYVGLDHHGYIRYDNDDDLIEYYRAIAFDRALRFFEGEALPLDSVIGGRPFGDWRAAAAAAGGRVLQHVAFAIRLKERYPQLSLRNLLTVFSRNEDIWEVLLGTGEPTAHLAPLLRAMTLDAAKTDAYAADHEIPLPFHIDFGEQIVLLPCFGALLNPMAHVVRFLRANFGSDWDRAVARRELLFRNSIRDLLPPQRFLVKPAGVRLRRPDGSVITDIDAIVLDREFGSLALLQLKWHDVHGRSLRERESRRRNLISANDWVDRLVTWINGRSAADVAAALDVRGASPDRPPYVCVMTRYAAQFVSDEPYDDRASWFGWADLVSMTQRAPAEDLLRILADLYEGGLGWEPLEEEFAPAVFHFEEITVEIRVV